MRLPTLTVWFTTRGASRGLGNWNVLLVAFQASRRVAIGSPAKLPGFFKFTSSHENTRSKATWSAEVNRSSVRWAGWVASRKV